MLKFSIFIWEEIEYRTIFISKDDLNKQLETKNLSLILGFEDNLFCQSEIIEAIQKGEAKTLPFLYFAEDNIPKFIGLIAVKEFEEPLVSPSNSLDIIESITGTS